MMIDTADTTDDHFTIGTNVCVCLTYDAVVVVLVVFSVSLRQKRCFSWRVVGPSLLQHSLVNVAAGASQFLNSMSIVFISEAQSSYPQPSSSSLPSMWIPCGATDGLLLLSWARSLPAFYRCFRRSLTLPFVKGCFVVLSVFSRSRLKLKAQSDFCNK